MLGCCVFGFVENIMENGYIDIIIRYKCPHTIFLLYKRAFKQSNF